MQKYLFSIANCKRDWSKRERKILFEASFFLYWCFFFKEKRLALLKLNCLFWYFPKNVELLELEKKNYLWK